MAESLSPSWPQVAVAILEQDGKFLMQLRDDNPQILYPGHWCFFGGHLEPGESAAIAVQRELLEEIGYCPTHLELWRREEDTHLTRHLYYGKLDVSLERLILGEGMDMALVSPTEIRQGSCYSTKIQEWRPLGKPHQQMLCELIDQLNTLGAP